ncbi:hypothetical protein [Runella zeae]|uniref:hypothetical protein n=2 Tax=Runella zeae TaxID=94255 RepID=UPI0012FC8153|nr:hypothetical protein [Runella zeae]
MIYKITCYFIYIAALIHKKQMHFSKFAVLILFLRCMVCISVTTAQQIQVISDSTYTLTFRPSKNISNKTLLIDTYHKTVFQRPQKDQANEVMLKLARQDGFRIDYINKPHLKENLQSGAILLIEGLPNEQIIVNEHPKAIFQKSPLSDAEVDNITRWIANGGRLFLFLSHYPNGSGGKPLLEALGVRFRDGGASHPNFPGINGDPCAWFTMTLDNGLINNNHPVLSDIKDQELSVKTARFLCATAIFRNPEDVILAFPKGTTHLAPYENERSELRETSDSYAGLLGFVFGKGKVIISSDLGVFRNQKVINGNMVYYNTITDPKADNAKLLVNCLRWLSE